MTDIVMMLRDQHCQNEGTVRRMCLDAASEIERLRKYEELVGFIANDYHELSHDKIAWQRNDWKKRCHKLIGLLND